MPWKGRDILTGRTENEGGYRVSSIVESALYRGIGGFFAAFVLLPAAVVFFAYVVYIVVKVMQEWRKK